MSQFSKNLYLYLYYSCLDYLDLNHPKKSSCCPAGFEQSSSNIIPNSLNSWVYDCSSTLDNSYLWSYKSLLITNIRNGQHFYYNIVSVPASSNNDIISLFYENIDGIIDQNCKYLHQRRQQTTIIKFSLKHGWVKRFSTLNIWVINMRYSEKTEVTPT